MLCEERFFCASRQSPPTPTPRCRHTPPARVCYDAVRAREWFGSIQPAVIARQLIVGLMLLLSTILVTLACSPPPPQAPDSPKAQATDLRRTAVAEVQLIIANKSTPTPPPVPTATPTPTCPNAIWWSEARSHTGETRTIQGTVIAVRPAASGATLVQVGQAYPDPTGLAVLLASGDATTLNGKNVCVAGRISLDEGRPTVQVRDATAVTVLD